MVPAFDHVVTRSPSAFDAVARLWREDHQVVVTRGHLSGGEVEFPRAAEPLVEQIRNLVPLFAEPVLPVPKGVGVMEPREFDVTIPAEVDIKDAEAGPHDESGDDGRLLGLSRLFQVHVLILETCAGRLHVAVEKMAREGLRRIVVPEDMSAWPTWPPYRRHRSRNGSVEPAQPDQPAINPGSPKIEKANSEQSSQIPVLDCQPAIDIRLFNAWIGT